MLCVERQRIVPCCTHEHAKKVRQEFHDDGWIAEHLHGKLPAHVRDGIVKKARLGNVNIITTVGVGVEGMDIPSLYGILWMRLTGSLTIWKQFNGRVLRLLDGKEWSVIADLAGNAVLHGMPDKVYKWSLENGVEKDDTDNVAFKKCWSCGTYNNPENDLCHWCGADISEDGIKALEGTCHKCEYYKKDDKCLKDVFCPFWKSFPGCPTYVRKSRSLPAMVDGKLIAITTDGQRQEIKSRADQKKGEIQKEIIEKEEKRNTAEKISSFEKRKILQDGLFGSTIRKSLLDDALRNY